MPGPRTRSSSLPASSLPASWPSPSGLPSRVALAAGFGAAAFVALARAFAAGLAGVGSVVSAAAAAPPAAASVRAVLLSAARALPAAVWAPFALPALPSAMRVLAAFAAAALPVVLVTLAPVWTWAPPRAAFTLRVRRDLRRAAAFGWIAPAFAARSSALSASARASFGSPSTVPAATRTAFVVSVFAALRRGWLIDVRRSVVRTRFSADGVLAPVQPRGLVAKSEPRCGRWWAPGSKARRGTPMVADGDRTGQRRDCPAGAPAAPAHLRPWSPSWPGWRRRSPSRPRSSSPLGRAGSSARPRRWPARWSSACRSRCRSPSSPPRGPTSAATRSSGSRWPGSAT